MRIRVVTLDNGGGPAFEEGDGFEICRVARPPGGQRAAIAALTARSIAEALRYHPQFVLCGHVVLSPAAWIIRLLVGAPWVLYLYAVELGHRRRLSAFAVRRASISVAISRHTEELALRLGAQPSRLRRIPPGVDLPSAARKGVEETPIVLTIAALDYRYKGHDVLCRTLPLVAAKVPSVRWVVIGDGVLRPQIERLAAAQSIDGQAHFLGRVSDAERDDWLDRASVFVMPSRLPADGAGGEGFGIAYLEAAARGIPVVAGDVGGARDAVVHGKTGLLVDPTDHVAVADAVCELLLDRPRATELGQAGARHVEKFTWPLVTRRLESVILGLGGQAP